MTETKNIAKALSVAQKAMGKVRKTKDNDHFKSKYATLADVLDACMDALNDVGIAVIQPTGVDEAGRFVDTVFIHAESGEELRCRVPLIVQKNDMQGFGSAVTYARRYGLMCMAGLAPEDDDGNAAVAAAPKQESKPKQRELDGDPEAGLRDAIDKAKGAMQRVTTLDDLKAVFTGLHSAVKGAPEVVAFKDARKAELEAPVTDDEIPY